MKPSPYLVRTRHPCAVLACLFMTASATLRCVYYAVKGGTALDLLVYLALPVAAALWLVANILFWGRTHIEWSILSVVAGVVFFIIKSFTFASPIHTGLCILLYLTVLVLFSLTVTGVIPTKVLLYPLFALPLVYHIFVEDMHIYLLADPQPPALEWLPEASVLCIMAALLCLSIAFEKKPTKP